MVVRMIQSFYKKITSLWLVGFFPLFCSATEEHTHRSFRIAGLTITPPEGWQRTAVSSPMRVAQLEVPFSSPDNGTEPGEVAFFFFPPGEGGSVDANIQRWFSQFQEPPSATAARTATEHHGELRVTFVAAQGTYKSGMPGGPTTPKHNYALRGAIIETPSGNLFIRFTGPRALVEHHEQSFYTLVRSSVLSADVSKSVPPTQSSPDDKSNDSD